MHVIRIMNPVLEDCFGDFLDPEEARGWLLAVFPGIVTVPKGFYWVILQPDLTLHAVSEYPSLTPTGWDLSGPQHHLGAVAEGIWELSLRSCPESIENSPASIAIEHFKKLIPSDSLAITMDADGVIKAWKALPKHNAQQWYGDDGDVIVVGQHANPKQRSWTAAYYINPWCDAHALPGGILQ